MDISKVFEAHSPFSLGVVIVLLCVLLGSAVFLVYRTLSRPQRNTLLLVGLSDSGKTKAFINFAVGKNDAATYSSIKENVFSDAKFGGKRYDMVDIPGADKVRDRLITHHSKGGVKAVVFMIDSSSFVRQAKDVARCLYTLLVNLQDNTPVLIACNKHDISLSKSKLAISNTLCKELTLLNSTTAAALDMTTGHRDVWRGLGQPGRDFDWTHLGRPIDFVECSCMNHMEEESAGLLPVREWLAAL